MNIFEKENVRNKNQTRRRTYVYGIRIVAALVITVLMVLIVLVHHLVNQSNTYENSNDHKVSNSQDIDASQSEQIAETTTDKVDINENENRFLNLSDVERLLEGEAVTVTRTNVFTQTDDPNRKILYPDVLQSIVVNKSGHTIKDLTIAFVAYDKNGYPVKIKGKFDYSGGEYVRNAVATGINLVDGASYGGESGFELQVDHQIYEAYSCPVSATFYDQDDWVNPHFETWKELLGGKPFPNET